MLMKNGVSLNSIDIKGNTPFDYAVENNNYRVIKLLLNGGLEKYNRNAKEVFKRNSQSSDLHWYSLKGNADEMRNILLRDIDINSKNLSGHTPLHIASQFNNPAIVELLIHSGSHVNALDNNNMTPLHFTSIYDNDRVASLLIKKGSDVNLVAQSSTSSLHISALWNSIKVTRILLNNGASVNVRNDTGSTPLYFAVYRSDINLVKLLVDHGSKINSEDKFGLTPLAVAVYEKKPVIVKYLIAHGADLNKRYFENKLSILHLSIFYKDFNTTKIIIDTGFNIIIKDKTGSTPLHYSVKNDDIKNTKLLLQKGAEINTQNRFGLTPLHIAVYNNCNRSNSIEIVKLLLKNGAKTDIKTLLKYKKIPKNYSPIDISLFYNNKRLFDLLKEQ
jgi:ankyrin repeat protein